MLRNALEGLSVTDDQLSGMFSTDRTVREMRDMISHASVYIK